MSYQYVGEDEHTFRVRHPDGSDFTIAKQAIGESVHKRIKSLEPIKMADGGIVPDEYFSIDDTDKKKKESTPFQIDPVSEAEARYPAGGPPQDVVLSDAIARPMAAPAAAAPAPIAQPSNPAAPTQTAGNMSEPYIQAFAQKESGIQDMATAQAQASQAQAKVYEDQANQIAQVQKQYQNEHTKIDAEHKQIVDAVMNNKIDPNRFIGSMSTGNKVLAAISVALSGLGSGLTGKENMAMGVIQKSIDRDIEAQRMELGKKQTLLSENVRRYGDLNTATQATMLQMNAMTQAKVSQAAARSGSVQAQAQAKMMLGDLGLQAAALKEQLAQKQVRAAAMSGSPISHTQAMSLPEEDRKRLVKAGDKYVAVPDENRAKKATEMLVDHNAVMSDLDKLISLRSKFGSETIPSATKAEMKTLATSLRLKLKEQKKLGTLDKGSQEVLDQLVADPTSFGFVSGQYDALKSSINRETQSGLKQLGVSDTNFVGAESPQIATRNGVQYKKVAGGLQRI